MWRRETEVKKRGLGGEERQRREAEVKNRRRETEEERLM